MHNLITLTEAVERYTMSEPYTLFNRKGEEIAEVTNCKYLFSPDGPSYRVLADLSSTNFPNVISKKAEINPKRVFVANPLLEEIVIYDYVPVHEYLEGKELPITLALYAEGLTDVYISVRLDEKITSGHYAGRLLGANGVSYTAHLPYETTHNACVRVPAITIKNPNTAIACSDVVTQAQLDKIPFIPKEAVDSILRHVTGVDVSIGEGATAQPTAVLSKEEYERQGLEKATDGNLCKTSSGAEWQELPWKPMWTNTKEGSKVLLSNGKDYKLAYYENGKFFDSDDIIDINKYTKYLQL